MGDMSNNFNRSEFACKGKGCCNHAARIQQRLVNALQKLRENINKPIIVVSGYRCSKHNIEVGGAKESMHVKGLAADIRVDGMSIQELYEAVLAIPAFSDGGVGIYKTWIHVDIREKKARWKG